MGVESRYRLAWTVCVLLLVGFIGNSVSNYLVSRHNVRKTITESSLPLTSDNIYSVIQRDLLQPIFISSMMANDAFLRDWMLQGEQNPAQIQRYLSEIVNEYNTVTSFLVSEKTRNYYYAEGILKQVREDEPRDEWYFRVRQMEDLFEINVDPDLANQDTMTIFINYRVFDFDGNYLGATGTGLTVNRVNSLIEEYEERFGRQIFFVDREGKIVLSPTNSDLKQYTSIHEIPGLQDYAESILRNEVENLTYKKEADNYFLNIRFVSELDWFLMVEQTEDVLLAPLRDNLYISIALALIITAIVAFVCITAIQKHQQRLRLRNQELIDKNEQIEHQRRLLQKNADELAKTNEQLSIVSREKDEFLGVVAHDLRNPLNAVLGFSNEVLHILPSEETTAIDYLNEIHNAGEHMLELIGDLLNVSFIESFHGPLKLSPANWNAMANDAYKRFQAQADSKNIKLTLKLDEDADQEVNTREKWIDICLNNIISNAIKYTPPATTITLETRAETDYLEIRVTDQGPGLTPDDIDKLFQKFVRLTPRPTGQETSTGLGLYIVQKMCTRLEATVGVDTQPGDGCTFYLRHPRR